MDVQHPAGAVVVGVDGSPASDRALAWAAVQARTERRPLVVAHAAAPLAGTWTDADGNRLPTGAPGPSAGEHVVADALARVPEAADVPDVHRVVRVGEAPVVLTGLQSDAAMCVVGSRGYGPTRSVLLGSVGHALVQHPRCPVVIHRPTPDEPARHGVVAGVDETPHSASVIEFAHRVARSRGLALRLVHAAPHASALHPTTWGRHGGTTTAPVRHELDDLLALLRERHPETPIERAAVDEEPRALLTAASWRHALLVLGAHHPGGPGLLPGRVTTHVVEHAHCPVAVVPGGA